mgnify:CR=1 FL=1|jgi:hypothetical protein
MLESNSPTNENKNNDVKICCICFSTISPINLIPCIEKPHTDFICNECSLTLNKCPLCLGTKNEFYKNLDFSMDKKILPKIENLYNKPNFQFKKQLEIAYPDLTIYNTNFKFLGGKYKNQWVSDIIDKSYLVWFITNVKLSNKNRNILSDRINAL